MTNRANDKHFKELIKNELYKEAQQRPARVELERRRLLAKVSADDTRKSQSVSQKLVLRVGLGFAVAATTVLIIFFFGNNLSDEPIVVSGLWRVTQGDPLARGRKMYVPPKSGAKVVLEDGTALWLDSSSEAVANDSAFTEMKFDKGSLLASVAQRKAPKKFRLKTPHGDIVVHGTVFSVNIDEDGVWIRLYEGEVEIEGQNGSVVLSPGHQVRVSGGSVLSMTQLDRAAVIADLMITEKTANLEGPPVPKLEAPNDEPKQQKPIIEEPPKTPIPSKPGKIKRVKPKRIGVNKSTSSPPVEVVPEDAGVKPDIIDPMTEAIEIEYQERQASDEDELIDKAYRELKAGHHAEARAILEKYVEAYPRARYWDHVTNVLGE